MNDKSLKPERPSARQRLLAAADELFYDEGINTVGIDRVIERAGVAKASLYDCFGSKEELIRSYLQGRHERRQSRLQDRIARHDSPKAKILAVFDAMAEQLAKPDFRGCAFVRASAEARPGSSIKAMCEESRAWTRSLFAQLATEAGATTPERLAQQLVLLYDGASVSAHVDHNRDAATEARAMVSALLENAIAAEASSVPR
jgi:AcrR family transcriptional regulator